MTNRQSNTVIYKAAFFAAKNYRTCLLLISYNIHGSTVRSRWETVKIWISDFVVNSLHAFELFQHHRVGNSPVIKATSLKTKSSVSQTSVPARCNCTFMKKVDGPKKFSFSLWVATVRSTQIFQI